MPYRGNECPDPRHKQAVVDRDVCYACACNNPDRRCDYPPFLIKEIANNESKLEDRYSPTALTTCHRALALKRIYEYAINPADYWPMVRGNTIHNYVANSEPVDGHIREEKLEVSVPISGGIRVPMTGTPDEYIPNQKHLLDYKTVKYISTFLTDLNKPKESWTAQLSCYAWMIFQVTGVQCETAEIVLVDPTHTKRVPYRLWDTAATLGHIQRGLWALARVYQKGFVPGVIPEADQWQCMHCPHRNACENVAVEDGQNPPNPEDRIVKRGR